MLYHRSNTNTEDFESFIVNGQPTGEVHWLRRESSSGAAIFSGIWRSGPLTFEYVFPGDEMIHAVHGEVEISLLDTHESLTLVQGDIIAFDKGVKSIWTIRESFVKFFVIT